MAVRDAFAISRGNDLTVGQTIVLLDLLDRPRQSMANIAQGLGTSPSACTQVVDNLVKKALLERLAEPTDRRVVYVDLSDSGRNLAERLVRCEAATSVA